MWLVKRCAFLLFSLRYVLTRWVTRSCNRIYFSALLPFLSFFSFFCLGDFGLGVLFSVLKCSLVHRIVKFVAGKLVLSLQSGYIMHDQRMDQFDYMGDERDFIDEMDEEDNGGDAGENADDYKMVWFLIPFSINILW